MDADLTLATLVGSLLGAAAALVPGAHPNTLAAFALLRSGGEAEALALVALGGAFAIAAPALGAFLGASDEAALSTSPAHRLLAQGRAREAAEIAADGALLGLLLALPGAAAVALLAHRALPVLEALAPFALLALAALLVLRARSAPVAAAILLLSGALGWFALRLGSTSPFGVPTNALLPLLAGLFGAPALLSLARSRSIPPQKDYRTTERPGREVKTAACGAAAGSLLGLLPALTPGLVAAPFLGRVRTDEDAIGLLAATTGAGAAFTLAALVALERARSGALAAARALAPPDAWAWTLALLVGATIGYAAARLGASRLPSVVNALSPSAVGMGGLTLLAVAVAVLSGAVGGLVAATGCVLALGATRLGAPRTALLGAILVPVLVHLVASTLG